MGGPEKWSSTAVLDILIVLVTAKVVVEIAERINVPTVVAEIVAGMIIRPVGAEPRGIGADARGARGAGREPLLLLGVGMEMDLGELGTVGRAASSVAVGIVVPMVGGYVVATAVGHDSLTDRNGRKLDDAAKTALIDAVNTGVTRKRKRFRRREPDRIHGPERRSPARCQMYVMFWIPVVYVAALPKKWTFLTVL